MSRTFVIIVVVAHLLISLVHGAAHAGAQIGLSPAQNAFVWIVVMIGPLAALALILAGWPFGGELLAATMAGSLVFGIVFHFVVVSPDHVNHVSSDTWRLPFQITAVLLALLESAGVWAGVRMSAATKVHTTAPAVRETV
jgi:hypothetical protein